VSENELLLQLAARKNEKMRAAWNHWGSCSVLGFGIRVTGT